MLSECRPCGGKGARGPVHNRNQRNTSWAHLVQEGVLLKTIRRVVSRTSLPSIRCVARYCIFSSCLRSSVFSATNSNPGSLFFLLDPVSETCVYRAPCLVHSGASPFISPAFVTNTTKSWQFHSAQIPLISLCEARYFSQALQTLFFLERQQRALVMNTEESRRIAGPPALG